jgi:hypothetical protein
VELLFDGLLPSINFPRSEHKSNEREGDESDQIMEPAPRLLRTVIGWFAHYLKPDLSSNFQY